MKPGRYSGQLDATNCETSLFEGYVFFKTYSLGIAPDVEKDPPTLYLRSTQVARDHSRYCDQPMDWRTRLFGFGGTASIIGLVLAVVLFTWKVFHPPVMTTSQSLTVVELQPLAAPPEPVRNVAPGPEQVEKQEAELEAVPEPMPVPMVQLASPSMSAREVREPVNITDTGPAVPVTTAPKSIAAPTVNRLSNDAHPNWEGTILAHLERFRRYPARARAARQQGTITIRFRMNKAGMVLSSTIMKKSGYYDLDQAALDTLKRAQPLPAIPADMGDEVELTIPVEFQLRR